MDRHERESRTEPGREEREPAKRKIAPPIEREHETYDGVFDEEKPPEARGEPERK